MSKVLKFVVLERENPLKLLEPQNSVTKLEEKSKAEDTVEASIARQRFVEEESKKILDDAKAKAREIIEESKIEAERLIATAQAEKEEIEKAAFDQGYHDGFEAGRKEQELHWNKYLTELNNAREELKKQNAIYREHLEKECLKLSLAIAEKILGKVIQTDGEYFLDLIKKGLAEAGEEREAIIRISEEDYDSVSSMMSKLTNGQHFITLLKDPTLSPGDCIIAGPNYQIDAGIRTQIQNIADALRKLDVI